MSGESAEIKLDGSKFKSSAADFAVHLNHRYDDLLFGGLVSFGSTNGLDEWTGSRFVTLASETQLTSGNNLVYFQAGLTKGFAHNNFETAPYLRAEVRHFLKPNTMVAANLGYASLTYDQGSSTIQHNTWGLDAEHRFDDSMFSVFGSYRGSHNNEIDEGERWLTHVVLVGVKMSFGGKNTLQATSKSGATLANYNPITGVDRLRFGDWE